jgi:hypothetical protein
VVGLSGIDRFSPVLGLRSFPATGRMIGAYVASVNMDLMNLIAAV